MLTQVHVHPLRVPVLVHVHPAGVRARLHRRQHELRGHCDADVGEWNDEPGTGSRPGMRSNELGEV